MRPDPQVPQLATPVAAPSAPPILNEHLRARSFGTAAREASKAVHHAPILTHEMLIVSRISKLEYLAKERGVPVSLLRAELLQGTAANQLLVEAHDQLQHNLSLLGSALGDAQLVSREDFPSTSLERTKLIISVGGDNHLQYVAQHVRNTPILGVNADTTRSDGALCGVSLPSLPALIRDITVGSYRLEQWARIDVELDGRHIGCALCDVACGELHFYEMSKHLLKLGAVTDLSKGSGLLVATGAGSSGWYNSVLRHQGESDIQFSRESQELRYVIREPYHGRLEANRFPQGTVNLPATLEITSLNDSRGVLVLDSLHVADFPFGCKATLKLSQFPLNVVLPK